MNVNNYMYMHISVHEHSNPASAPNLTKLMLTNCVMLKGNAKKADVFTAQARRGERSCCETPAIYCWSKCMQQYCQCVKTNETEVTLC